MAPRRFKFTTILIVSSLALTLASGARMLCACTTFYPIRWSLGVKIPDEIDQTTLEKLEQAASKILVGKSLAELSAAGEPYRQNMREVKELEGKSLAELRATAEKNRQELLTHKANSDERKNLAATTKDPESRALDSFVNGTSLRFLQVKSTDQVNDKTLTFQETAFSNLLWADQIVFTLDLDNQIIRQVKVTYYRKFFQVPRNFFASLVN